MRSSLGRHTFSGRSAPACFLFACPSLAQLPGFLPSPHPLICHLQAEGLLDASAKEFQPVAKLASWRVSDLYAVRRVGAEGVTGAEQRLIIRMVSKKKACSNSLDAEEPSLITMSAWQAVEEKLTKRVMAEIKLVGDLPPSPFIPSLLATFSDRSRCALFTCALQPAPSPF